MKHRYIALLVAMAVTGCASNTNTIDKSAQETDKHGIWLSEIKTTRTDYPKIEYKTFVVPQNSQTLTVANTLADKLGIEYVEWDSRLNPYEYKQPLNKGIHINYSDPQAAFLEVFDHSGLLPIYSKENNTVTIYPYSMNQQLNKPTIFSPMFDRSEAQKEKVLKDGLSKKNSKGSWLEYSYYEGYSIKDTIDAWANHAKFSSVVWYLDTPEQREFIYSKLSKNDSIIGQTPIEVINRFITDEQRLQSKKLTITAVRESGTNRLIIHPYSKDENVISFNVEATTAKDNLERAAKLLGGYKVSYQAPNYKIETPYTTLLSRFTKEAIESIVQQYPLSIEVNDSLKTIKVEKFKG